MNGAGGELYAKKPQNQRKRSLCVLNINILPSLHFATSFYAKYLIRLHVVGRYRRHSQSMAKSANTRSPANHLIKTIFLGSFVFVHVHVHCY